MQLETFIINMLEATLEALELNLCKRDTRGTNRESKQPRTGGGDGTKKETGSLRFVCVCKYELKCARCVIVASRLGTFEAFWLA